MTHSGTLLPNFPFMKPSLQPVGDLQVSGAAADLHLEDRLYSKSQHHPDLSDTHIRTLLSPQSSAASATAIFSQ